MYRYNDGRGWSERWRAIQDTGIVGTRHGGCSVVMDSCGGVHIVYVRDPSRYLDNHRGLELVYWKMGKQSEPDSLGLSREDGGVGR